MYIIFSIFIKLPEKKQKKTKAYPCIEQMAYSTVAQGTRHKAQGTRLQPLGQLFLLDKRILCHYICVFYQFSL
jgi:hypothetical protein